LDEFRNRLIHQHHCRGIGWKTIYQILKADPELKSLYDYPSTHYLPLLPPSARKTFLEDLHSHFIHDQIRQYPFNDIHVMTFFDEEYPKLLKEIYQPPWVLYGKGNIHLLNRHFKLAAVGSRNATEYGRNAIEEIFPKLIDRGVLLVSGLAAGIDTLVHKAAIKYGGETIGVIAGGLYHIYPESSKELAIYMMRKQLVLSEYPPNTKPSKWQFPMRNRIISGMSRGTFIIEAKQRSGSLITANYAVQEGREVFALPGNIFNPFSNGTNELIQQGAKLVQNYEDILEEFSYSLS
jgi:DNA processing protein